MDTGADADADGEVDTRATNPRMNSGSDPDENAKIGRKRPPRGPPASVGAGEQLRRSKRVCASGDGDHDTGTSSRRGAGQNKRLRHR